VQYVPSEPSQALVATGASFETVNVSPFLSLVTGGQDPFDFPTRNCRILPAAATVPGDANADLNLSIALLDAYIGGR
jgi:hypothetical protein